MIGCVQNMKPFYTLDDLSSREILDAGAVFPARLAVIGYPIKQSKSPQMQQAVLDRLKKNMRYIRVEATPDEFALAVERLRELDFIGANVTVPHKQAAWALSGRKEEFALMTGAVNTLRFVENDIFGFNTDGPGFVAAIREVFSMDVQDLKILILGAAGGAGTAIACACARNGCENLILANRTVEKAEKLKEKLEPFFVDENRLSGAMDRLSVVAMDDKKALADAVREVDLIVNATSLGLDPFDPSPIPSSWISPTHLVYDVLTHKTRFQTEAQERGARVSDGLSMLLHQGALAFSHWFGVTPDISIMKRGLGL